MSTITFIAKKRTYIIPQVDVTFQTLTNLFFIDKKYRPCPNLELVIRQLNFDFYHDLLPIIARWASDHTQSNPIIPLQAGTTACVTYTASQARYILANAFFLNTTTGYGSIDFIDIYHVPFDRVAIERIRCLIEYFRLSSQQEEDDNDHRIISIERYSYSEELLDWKKELVQIRESKINVFIDRMEASEEAHGFVDFANKKIHIHSIMPSATQEEILFSCCPEAFLSILVCDTLRSDEIVILRGCKRFVDYSGYGETFKFVGSHLNYNSTNIQDILIMDACLSNHFSQYHIDRDLGKVWAAFSKANDEIIVTGNWGCGVFGGDPTFKFLQQAMYSKENFYSSSPSVNDTTVIVPLPPSETQLSKRRIILAKLIKHFSSRRVLIFLVVGLILACVELAYGQKYEGQCPYRPQITLFLTVHGIVKLVACVTIIIAYAQARFLTNYKYLYELMLVNIVIHLIFGLFFLIWFILGNVWIWTVNRSVMQGTDPTQTSTYCENALYQAAKHLLIVHYILMGITILLIPATFMLKRHRRQATSQAQQEPISTAAQNRGYELQ
ncbi:unnamed protein product [Adineta steineri]|uniref:poly(ADP-ribose) glycohydrolase n=2 Tax=Adineta steineri TaxID=433720 RepID=A0A819HDN5_9BILA|nr:unnamed protein product [Adineta steineri]CAF3896793.1 unnamed protein product [Adineta steineri]